ncbi:carboxypeptidase regulatory-like domain-containing protein [Puia sp. P3]|uniref:carboxypeptidase-like regulatory domain-containing protein n=1 Tax=Puia sp. P3 TaxID=3423952 RepID=UPI003D67D104
MFSALSTSAQKSGTGIVAGNILEKETGKPVPGATVALIGLTDASKGREIASSNDGSFTFNDLAFGVYRLQISAVGFNTLSLDSINVRQERSDFNMSDLKLSPKSSDMDAVVVYAEKPLVQSKGGNLTFNAAESPLSAGASANELLRNVPLVATDANGNLIVEGKTPIVLIDGKPVNLNAQQLQDFLDALPGNMIEKIEVMPNPLQNTRMNREASSISSRARGASASAAGSTSTAVPAASTAEIPTLATATTTWHSTSAPEKAITNGPAAATPNARIFSPTPPTSSIRPTTTGIRTPAPAGGSASTTTWTNSIRSIPSGRSTRTISTTTPLPTTAPSASTARHTASASGRPEATATILIRTAISPSATEASARKRSPKSPARTTTAITATTLLFSAIPEPRP